MLDLMDGFNEYGCVRVELVKGGAVSGVARHHVRDYDEEHPAPSHIDPRLSKNNIYLDADGWRATSLATSDLTGRLKMAKAEHKRTTGRKVRNDANVAIDLMCYKSDLPPEKEKRFNNRKWLKDSFAWAEKEFGKNNVLGAALHMDEPDRLTGKVHPHIHIFMKPGIQTEKGVKLSAKELVPLGRYTELQDTYALEVGQQHGLKRGKKRARGLGPRHVSTHEFKERAARKEKKMQDRIDEIQDPEEVRRIAKKMAHEIAPGLVSQEIMKERMLGEFQGEIDQANQKAENWQNDLNKMVSNHHKLVAENQKLKQEQAFVERLDNGIKRMGKSVIRAWNALGENLPAQTLKKDMKKELAPAAKLADEYRSPLDGMGVGAAVKSMGRERQRGGYGD